MKIISSCQSELVPSILYNFHCFHVYSWDQVCYWIIIPLISFKNMSILFVLVIRLWLAISDDTEKDFIENLNERENEFLRATTDFFSLLISHKGDNGFKRIQPNWNNFLEHVLQETDFYDLIWWLFIIMGDNISWTWGPKNFYQQKPFSFLGLWRQGFGH